MTWDEQTPPLPDDRQDAERGEFEIPAEVFTTTDPNEESDDDDGSTD